MKKFFILVLFSLLFSIQNTSAVSPSLEDTIDFLINGDGIEYWQGFARKDKWSIDGCILTMEGLKKDTSGNFVNAKDTYDLNKINLTKGFEINKDGNGDEIGFKGDCVQDCQRSFLGGIEEDIISWRRKTWYVNNGVNWKRNSKALSHLFSNFCTGAKTAF